jgi:hypothetical protein
MDMTIGRVGIELEDGRTLRLDGAQGASVAVTAGALRVPTVVTAWPLGAEGRKRIAASAIHADDGGRLVAMARAVWIEVPSAEWNAV